MNRLTTKAIIQPVNKIIISLIAKTFPPIKYLNNFNNEAINIIGIER